MAARALVLVVAIAFSPSCCKAFYDRNHDFGVVEMHHLSLLQTAMQKRGTQAKAKQADPGRDALSIDSGATCMMMGDGGCTESCSSFADISSASSVSSMDGDADVSMGVDDIAADSEQMPSSKSLSLGFIPRPYLSVGADVVTLLVFLDVFRRWYMKTSGHISEVDGPEASLGDAVEDNGDTPLMDPVTSSSLLQPDASNAGVSVVETCLGA